MSELLNQIALVVITFSLLAVIIRRYVSSKLPLFALLFLGLFLIAPSVIAMSALRREGFQNSNPGSLSSLKCKEILEEEERQRIRIINHDPDLLMTDKPYRDKLAALSVACKAGKSTIPSVDIIGSGNRGIASAAYTGPTARNPFMNVLVDELKYNPTRPPAASVLDPSVQITLDEFFRTEFARDPTDVFGRNQNQRQFITMSTTSIPNDVDSYQKWLYKIPGKTCKEGGREACLPGTDGAAIPWLNQNQ